MELEFQRELLQWQLFSSEWSSLKIQEMSKEFPWPFYRLTAQMECILYKAENLWVYLNVLIIKLYIFNSQTSL